MTALAVYDIDSRTVTRYVRAQNDPDKRLVRTHTGIMLPDVNERHTLQDFVAWPPEGIRVANEPFDAWRPRQEALRNLAETNYGDPDVGAI